jgi:hypothetical protein
MENWLVCAGIGICLFVIWGLAHYDWLHLTKIKKRVVAIVTGHRETTTDGHTRWAAIYRFRDEAGWHEIVDHFYKLNPEPPIATNVALVYPIGHPSLARPPRHWLWWGMYAVMFIMLAMLVAKLLGAIGR